MLIGNYNLFVKELKSLLLKHMFYDMQEFFSCNLELILEDVL
jgi:hypothetical protein